MLVSFFKENTLVNRFDLTSYVVELYSNMTNFSKQIGVYSNIIQNKLYAKETLDEIAEAKKENSVYSLEAAEYSKQLFPESSIRYNISSIAYEIRKFITYGIMPYKPMPKNILDNIENISLSKSVINIMGKEKLNRNILYKINIVSDIIPNIDIKGKNIKKN
jgi:hypothetical protein